MELDIQKACRLGNVELLKSILTTNPAIINELDSKLGWAPIYRAVICGHYNVTEYLLKSGADPNTKNKLGETPLHQAADNGQHDLATVLLKHGADPNL
jgi:ankyrin repeat protein